jgi:hypothetical protein
MLTEVSDSREASLVLGLQGDSLVFRREPEEVVVDRDWVVCGWWAMLTGTGPTPLQMASGHF